MLRSHPAFEYLHSRNFSFLSNTKYYPFPPPIPSPPVPHPSPWPFAPLSPPINPAYLPPPTSFSQVLHFNPNPSPPPSPPSPLQTSFLISPFTSPTTLATFSSYITSSNVSTLQDKSRRLTTNRIGKRSCLGPMFRKSAWRARGWGFAITSNPAQPDVRKVSIERNLTRRYSAYARYIYHRVARGTVGIYAGWR